ncbi:MAG: GspE/PulE family protein [Bdellovibrionales bacterium]
MSGRVEKIDGLSIQRHLSAEEKLEGSGPFAALIRDAVESAIQSGASDIHFEPVSEGIAIRLRIGGVLDVFHSSKDYQLKSLSPATLRKSFFLELKRIMNLSLGKFGVAQDSRITLEKRRIEARVNLIPTIYGEKIVLRLFFKDRNFDLKIAGYSNEALADIRSAIRKNSGLVIISGETGSGKTTTLYSILNELDRSALNISSLEDPVEHVFEGVVHTQVNSRFGFGDGLRALLRQDPDVILVGEIRDTETAKLVNRAAQTGHLVFTTVHTNRALSIPGVFEFYGVKREEVLPNILLGANQRLMRKLCSKCRTFRVESGLWSANQAGCSHCKSGYLRERKVIFEYFLNLDAGSEPKLKRSIEQEITQYAKEGVIDESEAQDHCDLPDGWSTGETSPR